MRTRLTVLAAAIGVLSLGLIAPSASQAAPSTPDGQALVRIDGGTAYAKKKSKSEYRIVMPQGASITWMGEVKGRTTTGKFTGKALVAGWKKMGHSDGKSALTTLTWSSPGAPAPTSVLVKVAKPRVNSSGQVTFLAATRGVALPSEKNAIGLNVYWAKPTTTGPRGFPVTPAFPVFNVDSPTNPTATVQSAVQGSTNSSVTFTAVNATPAAQCWFYGINMSTQYQIKIPATSCGNGKIESKLPSTSVYSQVFYSMARYPYDGTVSVSFGYTPTGGKTFTWAFLLAEWDDSGRNTLPSGS